MASHFRVPQRARIPQTRDHIHNHNHSHNHILYARGIALSSRLQSAKPVLRNAAQTSKLRTQRSSLPGQPSSSTSSSSEAQSLAQLVSQRKWPLFGAGIAALCAGLYVSLVVTSTYRSNSTNDHYDRHIDPFTADSPLLQQQHEQPAPTGLPSTLLETTSPAAAQASARAFDKSLNWPERLSGITGLRRALAARARGHVLEVAVGTGRNLAYYDWRGVVTRAQSEEEARAQRERERLVRLIDGDRGGGGAGGGKVEEREEEVLSFTGVDVSGDMMDVARDRIRESVPGLKRIMRKRRLEPMPSLVGSGAAGLVGDEGVPVVDALDGRVRLVLGDALRGLPPPPAVRNKGEESATAAAAAAAATPPPPPPPTKYDTVIQTFGLCSVADPAKLLANMAARVQPDTGRILLLEHGRGSSDWMNRRLDRHAPGHFRKYGCWWNRDIERLVREASRTVPGLEIVRLERPGWFQWGTTLLIELRVTSRQA